MYLLPHACHFLVVNDDDWHDDGIATLPVMFVCDAVCTMATCILLLFSRRALQYEKGGECSRELHIYVPPVYVVSASRVTSAIFYAHVVDPCKESWLYPFLFVVPEVM